MTVSNHLLPRYLQVAEEILKEIRELKEGDRLTSEVSLTARHDCSRSTIRSAIANLVERGYLVSKQGIGNIVTIPKMREYKEQHLSFTQEMTSRGLKHHTSIVNVATLAAPSVAEAFELDPTTSFVVFTRHRFIDDQLAVLEDSYIQEDLFNQIDKSFVERYGLYAALEKIGMTNSMSVTEKLNPIILNEEQSKVFNVNGTTAMMSVVRTAANEHGVFEYTVAITDPTILEFTRHLTRG